MIMAGSRHGIPVSFHTEALHGGAYNGTVFPMPVLQVSVLLCCTGLILIES